MWRRGWLLVAIVAFGCAAPSRQLTTRAVEDPLVLPRGLASVSLGATVERVEPAGTTSLFFEPYVAYGLTDRLELNGLGLRYAFLDDAPAPASRAPFGLALRAGINSFGFSSTDGFVLEPALSLDARKHLGNRFLLWGDAGWKAVWSTESRARATAYNSDLSPNTSHASILLVNVGGLVQLVDHLTLSAGVGANDSFACTVPTCDSAARTLGASLGPTLRPRPWLSLSLGAYAGVRWRRDLPILVNADGDLPTQPPRRVTWLGVSGDVAFFW
jgi:hypothetical protein